MPFKGPQPQLASLVPKLQRTKAERQVCWAVHEGPRTRSKTSDADLDCAFEENALVFVVPNSRGGSGPLDPFYHLFTCFFVVPNNGGGPLGTLYQPMGKT